MSQQLVQLLALLRRQHVFGSVDRDLESARVEARNLVGLDAQIAHQPFWSDRSGSQLRQCLADLLEHAFENPEYIAEHLVRRARLPKTRVALDVSLEKRDRAPKVAADAFINLPPDTSPLSIHRASAASP